MFKLPELSDTILDTLPRWAAFALVPVVWHILAWCVLNWSIALHAAVFIHIA